MEKQKITLGYFDGDTTSVVEFEGIEVGVENLEDTFTKFIWAMGFPDFVVTVVPREADGYGTIPPQSEFNEDIYFNTTNPVNKPIIN